MEVEGCIFASMKNVDNRPYRSCTDVVPGLFVPCRRAELNYFIYIQLTILFSCLHNSFPALIFAVKLNRTMATTTNRKERYILFHRKIDATQSIHLSTLSSRHTPRRRSSNIHVLHGQMASVRFTTGPCSRAIMAGSLALSTAAKVAEIGTRRAFRPLVEKKPKG